MVYENDKIIKNGNVGWITGAVVALLIIGGIALMMRGAETVARNDAGIKAPATTNGSGVTGPATAGSGSTDPRR